MRGGTVNVLKFRTFFSFCSQIKCWFTECNSQSGANRDASDQTASLETVWSALFGRQLVFEILEHQL